MNLSHRQILGIGTAIVVTPSLIVGLVAAHFVGSLYGALAGFLMFIVTLAVAQIAIGKRLREMKASQEAQDAITRRLEDIRDSQDEDSPDDDNHRT